MSIFSFVKKKETKNNSVVVNNKVTDTSALANLVFNTIEEGLIITNPTGIILLANPAAMRMLGATDANTILNLQISSVLHLENGEGLKIEDNVNPIIRSINSGENYTTSDLVLVSMQEQRRPVAITVVCATSGQNERIITMRDIARELEEEGEQTEFISTASHEMRTPVASIEGYLGLALNPKTATIDDRARKYLEEAHASSKHLGRLFKDLLDVTKLDDKKIKVQLSPIEVSSTVRSIVNGQVPQMSEKGIHYTFGAAGTSRDGAGKTINQEVYSSVDIDFLREAINNLVENAIKYTATGGGIWVNVRGDDDRVLINVTDTGIGISPDDLKHIFQKFYRADNSQTRTVGGTGLGLYLVKQRVEAMGGKVWAESSFGEGSTFYLSFPRITAEEYKRRKQIASNIETMSPVNQVNNSGTQNNTNFSQGTDASQTSNFPQGSNISQTSSSPQNPSTSQILNFSQSSNIPQTSNSPQVSQSVPNMPITQSGQVQNPQPVLTQTPQNPQFIQPTQTNTQSPQFTQNSQSVPQAQQVQQMPQALQTQSVYFKQENPSTLNNINQVPPINN